MWRLHEIVSKALNIRDVSILKIVWKIKIDECEEKKKIQADGKEQMKIVPSITFLPTLKIQPALFKCLSGVVNVRC